MNRIYSSIFVMMLVGILLLFVNSVPLADSSSENGGAFLNETLSKYYCISSSPFPEAISFAGEKAPLYDIEVKERLDRELLVNTYWQSQTVLFHKRASRYFPIIESILKKNGIPDDFKYLALIESGFTQIVSPAGATGFWQIMKATGIEHGLEINKEVDERYHIEKSTEVACRYLQKAKSELGSWTLAAASYNMGITGIKNQLDRQHVNNYYNLLLNEETARYVFRILATKQILSNSEIYGFKIDQADLYPPVETYDIVVDTEINDFADFAKEKGLNYKVLKYFNPWLRQSYLTNKSKKEYLLKIPKKLELYIHEPENEFLVNNEGANDTTDMNSVAPSFIIYEVKEGEELESISKKYNVDKKLLMEWNKIENENLPVATKLRIYLSVIDEDSLR